MIKRLTKKVDNTHILSSLTKSEQDVLHLLTDEFLTPKQIQIRRQCSRQAVYKIIKKLKQKGAFNIGLQKVDKSVSTCQPKGSIRLHGQEINIRILWQDEKYAKLLKKSNILFIDGNTVRLYRKTIEIYSGQSFYGENEELATKKSMDYLVRFFNRLEHELKIILIKPRATNIRLVNQHYARTNSELSESSIEKGERIRVYAQEDGKLAFITDDSFGFKEDETVHPITAKQDRKAVDKQVNDWRIFNPPTNSQLAVHIENLAKSHEMFAENYSSHLEVLNKLGKAVDELRETIKEKQK